MKTELIAGSGDNVTTLDLKDDLPVSLTYSIAEVQDQSKRNGSYSKTVTLPGTKTNNKFFEHLYEVNVDTFNFNPNLKTACTLYQEDVVVIKGHLQLKGIKKVAKNSTESIEYEVVIYSNLSTLFQSIGEGKLTDLDFSAYNHTYNYANITSSWSATVGTGYVYPLIDYGYNNFATNYFHVEHFRPAIYVKTYLDKIFTAAGKTYTSTFLSTTFFKRLIIPNNDEKLGLDSSLIPNYQFYAGNNDTTATNTALTYSAGLNGWTNPHVLLSFITTSSCLFFKPNDDSTNPFNDPGGIYNTSNGVFTVPTQGLYAITGNISFDMRANYPAGAVSATCAPIQFELLVQKSTDGGATWTVSSGQWISQPTTAVTSTYTTYTLALSTSPAIFTAGHKYRVSVNLSKKINFYDGSSNQVTSGTASIDLRMNTNSTLIAKLSDTKLLEGNTLTMNSAIPKDIKQKDFFKSLVSMFNLYVTENKDNPNNYLIEPRDDFYANGTIKDWTKKLSIGEDTPMEIKPMGAVNTLESIWRYKNDTADYFNKQYFDKYQEPYGTHKETITNDFLTGQNVTEVIFSPTPIVDNPNNSMIIPKIFNYDGTTVKPVKHNIRILYYGGIKGSGNTWNIGSTLLGNQVQTTYPYAGMVDNPLAGSESIEFGIPNEIFYDDLTITYTNNNLYNRFYKKFFTEITDPDSKIVTAWLYLEPTDIYNFSFFDSIFLWDAYYIVNKINEYSATKKQLTKVEFLKLKTAPEFVPTSTPILDLGGNIGGTTGTARFGNTGGTSLEGEANNFLAGENVSSRSTGSVATGRNIFIGNNTYNITVISCTDVVIGDSVSGASIMNCSGIWVSPSTSGIALTNCKNITITDGTYDYVGIGLNGVTVPASDGGSGRMGTTFTFNDGSTH